MTANDAGEVGERLAAWLEGLGLADQLAEAGLPTFTRDADGTATWTDPATGEPMTSEQLEGLDALLHNDGTDPAHAVPVALVMLARKARVRAELVASHTHTYETLATLRGTTVNATRFAVHKAAADHALLVIADEGRTLVPAFQLGADGALRAELAPVIRPLLAAGMDPWNAWAWLTQPAGLLGGAVPEQAAADPEEADLVAHAACRLAERAATEPDGQGG
ncbi:hypothetical protein [Nocardioides sp. Root140]|uniref:hypothetical protein n=1 Tax=Nocardioides sp. Root140 TaxID=1736460 RepID=UPI0006F809C6|nr:hypothetical protein [Nocardioides sp. Root140]KQY57285.1 hypothetical protein ASD30_13725 [Nocardioides sp. Root140]